MTERLESLERRDKWFLSCGDGIIWAPPFPLALDRPGFWDEALVYYHPFAPLFSVAIVLPNGNELPLKQATRLWRPHELTVEWHAGNASTLTERRIALPGGRLQSLWGRSGDTLWSSRQLAGAHLVAYSAQPGPSTHTVRRAAKMPGIEWERRLQDRHNQPLLVKAVLAPVGAREATRVMCAAMRSEGSADLPGWEHTPFWETWRQREPSGLTTRLSLDGVSEQGLVWIAVAMPLDSLEDAVAGFSITLAADTVPEESCTQALSNAIADPAVAWQEHFDSYPEFRCSDPHLSRYYDYRLYGLRLNALADACGNVRHPAVAEGIGYFHVPITYSAQCHMWETRWSRDPSVAQGSLLNFLCHQRDDGSLHGRIYTDHLKHTDFYHANWGDAVLAVCAVHDDTDFVYRSYEGLAKYAAWLDRTRDSEQSGMYDILNHFETGQEYMSRYQAVYPDADRAGWQNDLRLKGIDVTVYAYQLKRCLAKIASKLGREGDADRWSEGTARIGSAILATMWNADSGMFSDVDPKNDARTNVKAAVCFYPLLTDLLDDEMVRCMIEHLMDPNEFATPFPVPSSSLDDPYFNANAEWKGKRHNCPWNGRTWPMTNSHIVEGLIRQWHLGRRNVGPLAADLLTRFVRMMFFDGDPTRPNCYEHYNPITGHPSVYRGIDDYQHSWVLDLLIRGVIGLEPQDEDILVDPLPVNVDEARLNGAKVQGRSVDISRVGEMVDVTIDGTTRRTTVGVPLRIAYD